MQNWQFYLHMLALFVIIILLYLFFREYKLQSSSKSHQSEVAQPVAPSHQFASQMPLSHAHLQTMQSMAMSSVGATSRQGPIQVVAANRFETESNLDRELSAEINDLCANQDAESETSSQSNLSSASQPRVEASTTGSPLPQVIEFVPKKKRTYKAHVRE